MRQPVKVSIMWFMAEDDIGEIRNELKEYKKQLDALREDLKLLIRHSPQVQNEIVAVSNQRGNRSFDGAEIERCRVFVEKYGIL